MSIFSKKLAKIMNYKHIAIYSIVFALCLALWPNLVHEQMHWLALRVQGLDGVISYQWGIPSHPSITKVGQITSVGGGLLFLLAPTILSLVVMALLHIVLPRVDWGDWEIAAHGVLTYVAFDTIINILGYTGTISDFHFLATLGMWGKLIVLLLVLSLGSWAILIAWQSRDVWWENGN